MGPNNTFSADLMQEIMVRNVRTALNILLERLGSFC
jgi:hypothetical protein